MAPLRADTAIKRFSSFAPFLAIYPGHPLALRLTTPKPPLNQFISDMFLRFVDMVFLFGWD